MTKGRTVITKRPLRRSGHTSGWRLFLAAGAFAIAGAAGVALTPAPAHAASVSGCTLHWDGAKKYDIWGTCNVPKGKTIKATVYCFNYPGSLAFTKSFKILYSQSVAYTSGCVKPLYLGTVSTQLG